MVAGAKGGAAESAAACTTIESSRELQLPNWLRLPPLPALDTVCLAMHPRHTVVMRAG